MPQEAKFWGDREGTVVNSVPAYLYLLRAELEVHCCQTFQIFKRSWKFIFVCEILKFLHLYSRYFSNKSRLTLHFNILKTLRSLPVKSVLRFQTPQSSLRGSLPLDSSLCIDVWKGVLDNFSFLVFKWNILLAWNAPMLLTSSVTQFI